MFRKPSYSLSNSNCGEIPKNLKNNISNICACKNKLQAILKTLNQLREKVNQLKNVETDLSEELWCLELNKLKSMKEQITFSISKYKDKSLLTNLKKSLHARTKKRNNEKRHQNRLKAAKQNSMKKRKILEQKTNEWVKTELNKVWKMEKSKEDAERSEIVLFAVNKKIAEAQHYIHLLDMAEKLRKCRNKIHAGKSYGEKNFSIKISRLRNVWRDALSEYELEKSKLKAFVSESTKSAEHQWKEVIFGEDFHIDSINTEAKTLQELIDIRRTWDTYIVPNVYSWGSAIPSGWVMPNDKPSKQWSLYKITD